MGLREENLAFFIENVLYTLDYSEISELLSEIDSSDLIDALEARSYHIMSEEEYAELNTDSENCEEEENPERVLEYLKDQRANLCRAIDLLGVTPLRVNMLQGDLKDIDKAIAEHEGRVQNS